MCTVTAMPFDLDCMLPAEQYKSMENNREYPSTTLYVDRVKRFRGNSGQFVTVHRSCSVQTRRMVFGHVITPLITMPPFHDIPHHGQCMVSSYIDKKRTAKV